MTFLKSPHGRSLSLESPCVMGVLNVTPDSFSDGGLYEDVEGAVTHALQLMSEGAAIVDVGGEASGSDSVEVSLEEELRRVVPVVRAIRAADSAVWISVDTWKAEVARQAIEAGADMVNDVTALRGDAAMGRVVAESGAPVVLMYSKDSTARTTREALVYDDVMKTVSEFLLARVAFAASIGIAKTQIVLDPGMGVFVSADARYSLEILKRLKELTALEFPVLVGASRKGFIQEICGGSGPEDRLEGSLAAALIAVQNGAFMVRAHDVQATARVLSFWAAVKD